MTRPLVPMRIASFAAPALLFCLAMTLLLGVSSEALAQPISSVPVSRIQIRVKTCNVANAGSADRLYVYFGGQTYPFYPGFAGGRNTWKMYDIVLPFVATSNPLSTLGELGSTVKIGKVGTDGWCIRQVEVYVNGWGENGGGDVFDTQARIFQSIEYDQWLDTSAGNVLSHTWTMSGDPWNYVTRPYLFTVRNSFGLHAIAEQVTAAFHHLTSPAGFLYGRPYTGTAQWNAFPVNAPLGTDFGRSFFFNTGLRTMSDSGTLVASPHVIPFAVQAPVAPNGLFYSLGVPGGSEGTSAIQSTLGAIDTMLARVMGPHDPSQAGAIYTRFGGVGSNDFAVWFVP